MSLQVWLPLNGNLKNQGLSQITATNYGATVDATGKIGNCYNFDGTDDYINITNLNCASWGQISICCWCYPIADFNYLFLIRGGGAHRIRISGDGLMFRDTNNSSQRIVSFGETIPQNTWSHIACIYNHGEITMYINGIETAHNITYYYANSTLMADLNEVRIARQQSTSGNNYYTGKINDFRIYDHALSAKEVEELAKGLALHYKLDDFINGICDCSGYNHNAIITGTASIVANSPRYNQGLSMNNASSANHIECNDEVSLLTDGISASFWVKAAKGTNQVIFAHPNFEFGFLNSLGYACLTSSAGFTLNNFINNEWNHIVVIRNDSTYKLYINGIEETRNGANNYYIHNGDKMWLLNRNYNNNYGANASISDFRIYATELTETQIQDLYYTSMAIDDKNNLYARELVEI